MEKNCLNRFHVIRKTALHCLIGSIELVGIPVSLVYLSSFLAPIEKPYALWQGIERYAICLALFEFFVIGILKMIFDTRKDALNALKTAYERAELYCERSDKRILDALSEKIDIVLGHSVLNQLDIIKEYENLKKYLSNKDIVAIKYRIICLQHEIETQGLLWNYTLLLRLFK